MASRFVALLCSHLRTQNLAVSIRERSLLEQAFWIDPDRDGFKMSVALIVAKSPEEEQLCNEIYDAFIQTFPQAPFVSQEVNELPIPNPILKPEAELPAPLPKPDKNKKHQWKWDLALLVFASLFGFTLFLFSHEFFPEATLPVPVEVAPEGPEISPEVNPIESSQSPTPEQPNPIEAETPSPSPSPDNEQNREPSLTHSPSASKPRVLPPDVNLLTLFFFYAVRSVQPVNHLYDLRHGIALVDQWGQFSGGFQNFTAEMDRFYSQSLKGIGESKYGFHVKKFVLYVIETKDFWSGVATIVLGWSILLLWQRWRTPKVQRDRFFRLWISKDKLQPYFQTERILNLAQHMNHLRISEISTRILDVPRTIRSTAYHANVPQLIWFLKSKSTPILFLQEPSPLTQQLQHVFDSLITRLQSHGISVHVWTIHKTRRTVFCKNELGETVTLEGLHLLHPRSYLYCFADNECLMDWQGTVYPWVSELKKWDRRVWLRPSGNVLQHQGVEHVRRILPIVPFSNLGLKWLGNPTKYKLPSVNQQAVHYLDLFSTPLNQLLPRAEYQLLCAASVTRSIDFPWLQYLQQSTGCPGDPLAIYTILPQLPEVRETMPGLFELSEKLQKSFREDLAWRNPLLLKQSHSLRYDLLEEYRQKFPPNDLSYANIRCRIEMLLHAKALMPDDPQQILNPQSQKEKNAPTRIKNLLLVLNPFRRDSVEQELQDLLELARPRLRYPVRKMMGITLLGFIVFLSQSWVYTGIGGYFNLIHDYPSAAAWYLKAAEAGNAYGQGQLGYLYMSEALSKNDAEARKWLFLSAMQGFHYAIENLERFDQHQNTNLEAFAIYEANVRQNIWGYYYLGRLYQSGIGQNAEGRDLERAAEWFEQAAELGSSGAAYQLGRIKIGQDMDKAIKWFEHAAELGNPGAAYQLGQIYAKGIDGPADYQKALEWFIRSQDIGIEGNLQIIETAIEDTQQIIEIYSASLEGDAEAQLNLAKRLGESGSRFQNTNQSHIWYVKAAEGGNEEAQNILERIEKPFEWYLTAAEQGDTNAQFHVAQQLEKRKNAGAALEWYRRAAQSGHAASRFRLGTIYKEGIGVDKNIKTAISFYASAFDSGNTNAARQLGRIYANGLGIPQNLELAMDWYRRIGSENEIETLRQYQALVDQASKGDTQSQYEVGIIYLFGNRVFESSVEKANIWFSKVTNLDNNLPAFSTSSVENLLISQKWIGQQLQDIEDEKYVLPIRNIRQVSTLGQEMTFYQIHGIDSKSIYDQLGLRNGDLLVSANSNFIDQGFDAQGFFQKLQKNKGNSLVIERNEEIVLLNYIAGTLQFTGKYNVQHMLHNSIERSWVDEQISNFAKVLQDARVIPIRENGKTYFQFKHIKKGSVWEKLGLQKRDTFLAVNGVDIDNVTRAMGLLQKLQQERNVSLMIDRNDKLVNLRYTID